MKYRSSQIIKVVYEAPSLKLVDRDDFKKTKLSFGQNTDNIVPKVEKTTDYYEYVDWDKGEILPPWFRLGEDFFFIDVTNAILYL